MNHPQASGTTCSGQPVRILEVERDADLKSFIDLPWKLYEGDPNWIPPLKRELKELLDPGTHPFWQFSERALFLACRGTEPVGRVAAIVNHNHNRFHNERAAAWGFFECANDKGAAEALFSRVQKWGKEKGMDILRGPLNPSTNYEIGMLLEGFDSPPTFMMPYNPPYYLELIEACGFQKEKDLLAYSVDRNWQPPDWVGNVARKILSENNVRVRHIQMERLETEVHLIKEIYHDAWFDNWGFVPMTDAEMDMMGRKLKRIIDPKLVFFIMLEEQPVGVGMIVPDINPLLRHFNGRIGLSGWFKSLLHRREITGLRGMIFGIKKRYQQMGLPLVAFDYLYRGLLENSSLSRYRTLELGWNLEDNDLINKWYDDGGAKVVKKFRIFSKRI